MLEGGILTLDAMGCQRESVEEIRTQQADCVISLKGNQGTLRRVNTIDHFHNEGDMNQSCQHKIQFFKA